MRSYREVIVHDSGKRIDNALVEVRELGTTTPVTDLYIAETGGDAVVPARVLTKDGGKADFWLSSPRDVTLYVTDNDDTATYTGSSQTLSFAPKLITSYADRAAGTLFVPTGTLAAGNVQDALAEENSERTAADTALGNAITAGDNARILTSAKGQANGVAPLDGSGKVPSTHLPAPVADAVTSVNTETGDVVLSAGDVGAIPVADKGAANGVAPLDSSSKVPVANLPAVTITDTTVVADVAAMLALTAQTGDVAVVEDAGDGQPATFILRGSDPTVLANWQQLPTPTDAVLSVNGETGVVDLSAADVGAPTVAALTTETQEREAHEADTNNPHATTAAQVGAIPVGTQIDADKVDGYDASALGVPDLDRTTRYRAIYSGIRAEVAIASLRIDDNPTTDYTKANSEGIYELVRARFLPISFAVNPGTVGQAGKMTAAQLREVAYGVSGTSTGGHETMDHSDTHWNETLQGQMTSQQFEAETRGSLAKLRAESLPVDSFAQPGTWANEHYFDTVAKLNSPEGRLLRELYAVANAYVYPPGNGNVHEFPMQQRYGTSHITISDNNDVNSVLTSIDNAIRRKGYIAMILHSADIGVAGKLTMANLIVILNYLKTKVDAELLRMLTATSALFAERGIPENLVYDGGFERQTLGAFSNTTGKGWFNGTGGVGSGGAPVIANTGRTGQSLQISANNSIEQAFAARNIRRALLTAYARTLTPGTAATARFIWRVIDGSGAQILSHSLTWAVGDAYTKIQALVGVPPAGERVHLWPLYAGFGPNYELDDVSLVKV